MRLMLLMVTAVLVAGCTTTVAGSPSAPSGVLLPPRPREVRLDGVDPCSLLSPEQRVELGFDESPVRSSSFVALFRGEVSSCTITGFEPVAIAVGIGLVTSVGIERWQEGDLAAEVWPTSAGGFPAVVAAPTRSTEYCSVDVDVAAGQILDVQILDGGREPPIPQDELCALAKKSAEEIMQSLLGR